MRLTRFIECANAAIIAIAILIALIMHCGCSHHQATPARQVINDLDDSFFTSPKR